MHYPPIVSVRIDKPGSIWHEHVPHHTIFHRLTVEHRLYNGELLEVILSRLMALEAR